MGNQTQGASAPTFTPSLWLAALSAIGGGYALMADRRLAFVVKDCDGDDLARVMSQIVGNADRQEALKRAIEQRQAGELTA